MITHSKVSEFANKKVTAASIESGSSLSGGNLLNTLKKFLMNSLKEAGMTFNSGKSKRNSDGSVTHKMTFYWSPEGDSKSNTRKKFEFLVNGKPTDDTKQYVNLSFRYPDLEKDPSGETMKEEYDKYTGVPNKTKDIMNKCREELREALGEELEEAPDDLSASIQLDEDNYKVLKFDATKVVSSTVGHKIQFKNIYANYDPLEVNDDIHYIASEPDFSNSLSDKPNSYGVLITDSDYYLEPASLDDSNTDYAGLACYVILNYAYRFLCDCKYLEYSSCGVNRDTMMNIAQNYEWRIQNIIDTLSRRIIEHKMYFHNPLFTIKDMSVSDIFEVQCPKWSDFESVMRQDIQSLVTAMNVYSSNFSKEDESEILEWIRSWKLELEYSLPRYSENC